MMNNTMRTQCNLKQGDRIVGKWNKNEYKIIKELGSGANGIVYLVRNNGKLFALKLSDNGTSIISEMNTLKSFSKVRGSALGPSFFEADDFLKSGLILPFYVMEYIEGVELLDFVQKEGTRWIGVLMLQLLTSLADLHNRNWVFGDLKPENLIVTNSYKVRCVDVGGTTVVGRSIKEFTEFFDRGYWGLGSRRADPQYDLFAVAMIMLNSVYPTRFSKKGEGYSQLKEKILQKPSLNSYRKILENALLGRYNSAVDMREDLIVILNQLKFTTNVSNTSSAKPTASTRQTRSNNGHQNRVRVKQKRKGRFVETFVLVTVISFLYVLYIYEQLL